MKIIQLTTFFYPVHGGVEQMVLQLSKRLKEFGHQVKIITSDSSKKGSAIRPFKEDIEGVEVERCRTWLSLSYFHKLFPSVFFKLLREDFDVIHVQGLKKVEGYIALFVAKLKGKKVIVSTHNPFVVDPAERPFFSNLFIKLHDLTFGKLFMRFFDKFLCLSKSEFKQLEKFGVKREKMVVIPNAVPDIVWEKGDSDKIAEELEIDKNKWKAIVLNLGRISKRKGLQNLKLAVDNLPSTLFVFAGPDDGYADKLSDLYKDNKNVIFPGAIEREKTKDLYELADIWTLPSLYEPFGVVLIEAMAKGLPVVATQVGGPKEIVKNEFGFLVDPNDQEEIFKKIKILVESTTLRTKMGREAKREAAGYKWSSILQEYLNVYEETLSVR